MKTRNEIVAEFSKREDSSRLSDVKSKAARQLKNLPAEDKLLVVDLMRLKEKFGLAKIHRLLQIINLAG